MTKNEKTILQMVYNGILSIDESGRIWRIKKKHKEWKGYKNCEPKQMGNLNHKGYVRISLRNSKGKIIKAMVHRIVWSHYNNTEIPDNLQVNHKNGIKEDNIPSNLELATSSEQTIHAINVLGRKIGNRTKGKNRKGRNSKITEKDAINIRRVLNEGISAKDAAALYNMSPENINNIKARRTWRYVV